MPFIDEYRNERMVLAIAGQIREISTLQISLMEVCGGHTMAIHKSGLQAFLPENIRLLSGPGCPVCVSSQQFVDHAIAIGRVPGVILTTYGDLVRVPGSVSSLEKEKGKGVDVRIVYSVLDALELASANRKKKVVFLGIGFETTAPASAAAIIQAGKQHLQNFFLLSAHKVMPPALETLANTDTQIDGFIAPGHVSAITGYSIYRKLTELYQRAVVISGFEPVDILQSILMLVRQIEARQFSVENEYTRVVRAQGNPMAQELMEQVFTRESAEWRGLGWVPESGLYIAEEFAAFDAAKQFKVRVPERRSPKGCICGEILIGKKRPSDCPLFSSVCTPVNPIGACMVSSEGTCSIFYKYHA
ncbi:MAG: hydrogenase formation protein HypD [Bacteroidales bacterium]|nr:hydrogenase formation protein HypD [Bacteroidales bacterium]